MKIPFAIVLGFIAFGLILRQSTPKTETGRSIDNPSVLEQEAVVTSSNEAIAVDSARVTFVVDGDTVELENGERVRLIGIDTPERGKPLYGEARAALAALVLNKTVRLEHDISERDRYGRLLAYLYIGEQFVNFELVRAGFAKAYTYPPDVAHAEEFVAVEQEARTAGRGLWGLSKEPGRVSMPKSNITSVAVPDGGYELPVCATADCDCADFASQGQAQWFHETHNAGDTHRLDRDKDGRVCETLL